MYDDGKSHARSGGHSSLPCNLSVQLPSCALPQPWAGWDTKENPSTCLWHSHMHVGLPSFPNAQVPWFSCMTEIRQKNASPLLNFWVMKNCTCWFSTCCVALKCPESILGRGSSPRHLGGSCSPLENENMCSGSLNDDQLLWSLITLLLKNVGGVDFFPSFMSSVGILIHRVVIALN